MEDTLLKVLNIPIATSGNPLGEYTHINNIIGPAIGVGGTIYNLVTLKSTNFHQGMCICIHGLWTCTFPVLVIIHIKHYLYSCMYCGDSSTESGD